MPAQSLVCIWQAVFARNSKVKGNALKEDVRLITAAFAESPAIRFRGQDFEKIFTGDVIGFDQYVEYVYTDLIQVPDTEMVAEAFIENTCWNMCKDLYSHHYLFSIGEVQTHQLWNVFNRLCEPGVVPPSIDVDDMNWIGEKVATLLEQDWACKIVQDNFTFCDLMDLLVEKCFSRASDVAIAKSISDLHASLVQEVTMTGWLHMRKGNAGGRWTWWSKCWFVLDATHLFYYSTNSMIRKRGEIPISQFSTLEVLPDLRTLAGSYKSRFAIISPPACLELSAADEKTRHAWMDSLEEVINSAKMGTTPVQAILRQRMLQRNCNAKFRTSSPSFQNTIDNNLAPIPQKLPNNIATAHVSSQLNKIEDVLCKVDKDDNGCIDFNEFRNYILGDMHLHMTDEAIHHTFNLIDADHNGIITVDEFARYFWNNILETGDEKVQAQMKRIRKIFQRIDQDDNGSIESIELKTFIKSLGLHITDDDIDQIFSKIEVSNDDVISIDEFTEYFMNNVIGDSDEACSKAEARLQGAFLTIHTQILAT